MTLENTVKYIRSKNAGPFWMTIDIFFDTRAAYQRVKESERFSAETIAAVYHINPKGIKRFDLDDLMVIKISMPRPYPQGAKNERDMHSGQQYVQLLDLEV